MIFITVRGAYGRTYKSGKAMKADWNAGLDFKEVQSGSYISNKEIKPGMTVHGRFKNDAGICQLTK